MSRTISILFIALVFYFPLYDQVRHYLIHRPVEEKMGFLPDKDVVKILALNYKPFFSEWLFLKTIVYYGGKIGAAAIGNHKLIDYYDMYRFLDVSTYIDPYNIDSYYVAQALFPWEGFVKETNYLLERGLSHRTWDFYIPFFLAFNNFYFLKDYKEASRYMETAARIKKEPLLINLAARFLYESGETEVAIIFLKEMIKKTWNKRVRHSLEIRLQALEAIHKIEQAIRQYKITYNRMPENVRELLSKGLLDSMPQDPYGGEFYIDKDGRVKTTSKLVQKKHK